MKNLLNLKRLVNAALPSKATLSRQAPNNTQILREFKRINAHETACIQMYLLKILQQLQTAHATNTWGRLNSTLACNNNCKNTLDTFEYYKLLKSASIIDVKSAYNTVMSLHLEEMYDKATTIVIALSIEKETDNCVLQLLITTTFKTYAENGQ